MGSSRGGFMGRGNGGGDTSAMGRSSFGGRGGMGERFQAIRDSIQAAHGGKLSQDELRTEMQKIFASRMQTASAPVQQSRPQPAPSKDAGKFGIVSKYPVYEKSAYVPAQQSGRGRVWILKSNGLLESIFVRTGLNDGRYTEISSPRLKPGDQVVLGATSNGNSGQDQARSPFSSGGRMGGGFR
jgi:multidrug efflux pump subunit AcrA (membrane-fusion protein)